MNKNIVELDQEFSTEIDPFIRECYEYNISAKDKVTYLFPLYKPIYNVSYKEETKTDVDNKSILFASSDEVNLKLQEVNVDSESESEHSFLIVKDDDYYIPKRKYYTQSGKTYEAISYIKESNDETVSDFIALGIILFAWFFLGFCLVMYQNRKEW